MSQISLAERDAGNERGLAWRRFTDRAFQILALVVLLVALASLGALIYDIVSDGAGRLSWSFITNFSRVERITTGRTSKASVDAPARTLRPMPIIRTKRPSPSRP